MITMKCHTAKFKVVNTLRMLITLGLAVCLTYNTLVKPSKLWQSFSFESCIECNLLSTNTKKKKRGFSIFSLQCLSERPHFEKEIAKTVDRRMYTLQYSRTIFTAALQNDHEPSRENQTEVNDCYNLFSFPSHRTHTVHRRA
jgi:hypothetical protein